ncbi:LysR substrate-binding domain-containing protein, partial [Klebsiella pneumoniae]|uniref:LysR substrate-binding domain-containing protein n=1 Tax=Klebsiella pneumoniae TaxID=573 RepID=UPI002739A9DD
PEGPQKLLVNGHFDADDGDVLTDWALESRGIANRPHYEVAEHLESGRLVEVLPQNRPLPAQFGVLTPHRRLQDPKVRLFADFIARETRRHFLN